MEFSVKNTNDQGIFKSGTITSYFFSIVKLLEKTLKVITNVDIRESIFFTFFFALNYKKIREILKENYIFGFYNFSGCSVARLSRRVWDAEVAGSNPATPTKL